MSRPVTLSRSRTDQELVMPENRGDQRPQRTLAILTERLDRHRGAGQQSITVKHITVNADNAIVGDVNASTGGGRQPETKNQPHAITHALAKGALASRRRCPTAVAERTE